MTLSGYYYHASAGETFDSVALQVYGDEKYAADLMSANGQYIEKNCFTGGETLALPVVETTDSADGQENLTAPWKE